MPGRRIYTLDHGLVLKAEQSGLMLCLGDEQSAFTLASTDSWPPISQPFAKTWKEAMAVLIEQELAVIDGKHLCFPYERLEEIDEQGLGLLTPIARWTPHSLYISSKSAMGLPGFHFLPEFRLGNRKVFLTRIGAFVFEGDDIFRLPTETYRLLEAIDKFNKLPSEEKNKAAVLTTFGEMRHLIESIDIELTNYLRETQVVIPAKVSLEVDYQNDLISFFPYFEGVPREKMRDVFLKLSDIQNVYDIQDLEAGCIYVVVSDDLKKALQSMQRIRGIGGEQRNQILADPRAVFEGVCDQGLIDLRLYGPRVRGIGDFPIKATPFLRPARRLNADSEDQAAIGLKYEYPEGDATKEVPFVSSDELREFSELIQVAKHEGKGSIDFKGTIVPVTDELVEVTKQLLTDHKLPTQERFKAPRDRRYLLIYTNESAEEYNEKADTLSESQGYAAPRSLRPNISLKPHQRDGIAWLQHLYRNVPARRGALLADDMGLGKTLQVLTFVAWLIENGETKYQKPGSLKVYYRPILIVAPLILLPTWKKEMKTFFQNDGAIFLPNITLHGQQLAGLRSRLDTSQGINSGEWELDLNELTSNCVIISNYDTVKNYERSLGQVSWSAIITDEAQNFKEHKTAISYSLKALNPEFRIACTGTPIENRLTDLWNIVDFLQPGNLLGSGKDFIKNYERPALDGQPDEREDALDRLRHRLRYNKQDAYVLRRDKNELKGLKNKITHRIESQLSPEQRLLHTRLLSGNRQLDSIDPKCHQFTVLDQLSKLTQHPQLLNSDKAGYVDNVSQYIRACPKIESLIEILKKISGKQEKVLIFTRLVAMQLGLQKVIEAEFGICPDILNGTSPGSRQYINQHREKIIAAFENASGFNILILSPEVGGVGLTLTAANHVIHYGRWWNPAKEKQATDRVFRIGQARDVHIYLLIATDPKNEFMTFDEKLDSLLEKKAKDMEDFLVPPPGLREMGEDLLNELSKGIQSENLAATEVQNIPIINLQLLSPTLFEALIAEIYHREGFQVVLTPLAHDRGIDVVAYRDHALVLIQCKHTSTNRQVGPEGLSEVINGAEYYLSTIVPSTLRNCSLQRVLVTNGQFDSETHGGARNAEVELIAGAGLKQRIEKAQIMFHEIGQREALRAGRIPEVKNLLERLINI